MQILSDVTKKVTIKFEHTSQNFVQVLKIQHFDDDCPN